MNKELLMLCYSDREKLEGALRDGLNCYTEEWKLWHGRTIPQETYNRLYHAVDYLTPFIVRFIDEREEERLEADIEKEVKN